MNRLILQELTVERRGDRKRCGSLSPRSDESAAIKPKEVPHSRMGPVDQAPTVLRLDDLTDEDKIS